MYSAPVWKVGDKIQETSLSVTPDPFLLIYGH